MATPNRAARRANANTAPKQKPQDKVEEAEKAEENEAQQRLTLKQALANIDVACASFHGSRQEHIDLIESVSIVRNICEKQPSQQD
jgi:hypothetical protein